MLNKNDIDILLEIAEEAGKEILKVYNSEDFETEIKSDGSPLTKADNASHKLIYDSLTKHFPNVPVVSEEGKEIDYDIRRNFTSFWLVDPLDGTKEFIKKNGEFTVNIALIENNVPMFGVIYAPAYNENGNTGKLWWGGKLYGSFARIGNEIINLAENDIFPEHLTAVISRSHATEGDQKILSKYQIENFISVGSSLKFCMIAEGKADLYHRSGPTNEWDVAAGCAIAEGAGSQVDGVKFNKESFLNSSFTVLGKRLITNK